MPQSYTACIIEALAHPAPLGGAGKPLSSFRTLLNQDHFRSNRSDCRLGFLTEATASAGSFDITAPSTSAQTLGPGAGQTGTIESTGSLTVSGSTNAVTISGDNATLTNLGTLMTSLNSAAAGNQVVDFNAILSGANTVNNFAGAVMQASEADAVRPGVNGVVNNAGTIKSTTTTGSSSDGVDAQSNSGVQITNDTGGLIEGGRHGITGGQALASSIFTMRVTNNSGATIQGDNGSGIYIDAFNGAGALETVTVVNHGLITGNGVTGDGDGVDVDGLVNITNTGTILSKNAVGSASEGLSVGGGTITNSGTIEGSLAAGNTTASGVGVLAVMGDTTLSLVRADDGRELRHPDRDWPDFR
jgi:hypothetical protein